MDFDEYEYLEKMVEKPEADKSKGTSNEGAEDESLKSDRRRSSRHKTEPHTTDLESRGSDRHRDRDRDRGSSRHRSRSRDVERSDRGKERHRSSRDRGEKERDERSERNGRDRERGRDKDKDKDHHERDRERREKDGEKDKERDRDGERERDRRSRSHSEKRRDDREKSRDREQKEREMRERDRETRRHKDKKEDAPQPEVDPERDQRTVFAYQIALRADERDVYEFFSKAGKVRDVRLIMDRNSRRSKGVGYIEFYDSMSVPMAITLSGQPLFGQPVMVKPSEAEKNLAQSTTTASGTGGIAGPFAVGGRKLYVGNLHYNITEVQLRQVFEAFGTVELVQMPLDETGHCKGFGFVQFSRLEDAKAALTLNGQLEIAGRTIKVSAVTDQLGLQDGGKAGGDLDDDEGGGLSLNAQSRALLMAKLDRSGAASSTGVGMPAMPAPLLGIPPGVSPLVAPFMQAPAAGLGGLTATALSTPSVLFQPVETIGVPSECLLLKNMFDPSMEEGDFDLEIKDDVETECEKHGTLRHIFVDKDTAGFVYLRFADTKAAINAQRALHGRYFAGKMITATFMVPLTYEAKFPGSG